MIAIVSRRNTRPATRRVCPIVASRARSPHAACILCSLAMLLSIASPARGQTAGVLEAEYALGGSRDAGARPFEIETRMTMYAPDGERSGMKVLRLRLRCTVDHEDGTERQRCTALDYTMQRGEADPVTIPALEGWTYEPGQANEQLLGIDRAKFEGLVDSEGTMLPPDESFYVYNSFIDFHMFDQVFANASDEPGIQNLRRIGDEIVHYSAFSEPAVTLGSMVAEGSVFRNGEITLRFKGLSVVDDRPCALIGYDSGESSFTMILDPMPNMRVTTTGASHYQGDFCVDLQSNWLARATLHELVVSETILPVPPGKANSIIEREIVVRQVEG